MTNHMQAASLAVSIYLSDFDNNLDKAIAAACLQGAAGEQGRRALVRFCDEQMAGAAQARALFDASMAEADRFTAAGEFDNASIALAAAKKSANQVAEWVAVEGGALAATVCQAIQASYAASKAVSPEQATAAKNSFQFIRDQLLSITGCAVAFDRVAGEYVVKAPADPRNAKGKKSERAKLTAAGKDSGAPAAGVLPDTAPRAEVMAMALDAMSPDALMRAAMAALNGDIAAFNKMGADVVSWQLSRNAANVVDIKKSA